MVMVVNDEKNQDEDDDGDGGADVDCGEKHSQFYTPLAALLVIISSS